MFPSVEIRHLLAVIALAEELNFRRAADRLHITQPALSKQITDLETENDLHADCDSPPGVSSQRPFSLSHTGPSSAHEGSTPTLTSPRLRLFPRCFSFPLSAHIHLFFFFYSIFLILFTSFSFSLNFFYLYLFF